MYIDLMFKVKIKIIIYLPTVFEDAGLEINWRSNIRFFTTMIC